MTWYSIYKELSRKVDDLAEEANLLEAKGAVTLKMLREAETKERGLIDEMCEQYAKDNTLPININQIQKVLIYVRLGHAAQFAELLSVEAGDLFSNQLLDSQKATVLKFLLVDYWKFAGCSRWHTT